MKICILHHFPFQTEKENSCRFQLQFVFESTRFYPDPIHEKLYIFVHARESRRSWKLEQFTFVSRTFKATLASETFSIACVEIAGGKLLFPSNIGETLILP